MFQKISIFKEAMRLCIENRLYIYTVEYKQSYSIDGKKATQQNLYLLNSTSVSIFDEMLSQYYTHYLPDVKCN